MLQVQTEHCDFFGVFLLLRKRCRHVKQIITSIVIKQENPHKITKFIDTLAIL